MYANSINEAFLKTNQLLIEMPEFDVVTRGLRTKELINYHLTITNPYDRIVTLKHRNISMWYAIGELCWYLRGNDLTEQIAYYSKFWNNISDDGKHANSAYGKRLFHTELERRDSFYESQFQYALSQLVFDKYSRKSIMMIYDVDDSKPSKDNPCTLSLQFFIRDDKLELIVNMRSNDLFFGFTYDVQFFTIVQEIMLVRLQEIYPEITMGYYHHNCGSMHLYEKDFYASAMVYNDNSKLYLVPFFPRLQTEDVCHGRWFNHLLAYEYEMRTNNYAPGFNYSNSTDFQSYCINTLRETFPNGKTDHTNNS